ncbi:hypothetical protein B4113_1536 [Geobacillus sp. B4113_201601]|nr:hypothetical protein B4113_1536 [Geobacillus sp. B4113_201601]
MCKRKTKAGSIALEKQENPCLAGLAKRERLEEKYSNYSVIYYLKI